MNSVQNARPALQAWNPLPYLNAIQRHFMDNPKNQTDRVIPLIAHEAYQGQHHAFHVLGDALQESSDPEWYHTPVRHGLSWPPWEGKQSGHRFLTNPPQLTRHVLWPLRNLGLSGEDLYRVYKSVPSFDHRSQAHHWSALTGTFGGSLEIGHQHLNTKEELRRAGFVPKLPIEAKEDEYGLIRMPLVGLTSHEQQLLSSPSVAEARHYARMVSIARPHNIKTQPIAHDFQLISEHSARKLAGVLPRRYGLMVHHQGKEYRLANILHQGERHWSLHP